MLSVAALPTLAIAQSPRASVGVDGGTPATPNTRHSSSAATSPGTPLAALAAPPRLAAPTTTTAAAVREEEVPEAPAVGTRKANLHQAVLDLEANNRPENTALAMDPKKEEWMQYCDCKYSKDPLRYIVTADKLYDFMCYQSFRERKPPGGNKALLSRSIYFDEADYNKVMGQFDTQGGKTVSTPKPTKPVGYQAFNSYKAAIKQLYHDQQAKHNLQGAWETVWQPRFTVLRKHVQMRKQRVRKENYAEKIDAAFEPYAAVEKFDQIEQCLWELGVTATTARSVNTALRHRCCALYSTSGVLRGESVYQAELSDFRGLTLDRGGNDLHPIFVLIMSIPFGKTNYGGIRYGRSMRHRNVKLCAVGSVSLYLMYRINYTNELADMTLEDWLDNKKWFDIKFLSDVNGEDNTKQLQNDSYTKRIKIILKNLQLSCNKLLHLGRGLGAKILDFLEEGKEEKRSMGQWSPDVVDNSYSSKLPMGPMRKLAGYHGSTPMYYNTRTVVEPSQELLRSTPIGRFCYNVCSFVGEKALASKKVGEHLTALNFLKFLCEINKVFLQDAAAMIIADPEREKHRLYRDLEVLSLPEFQVSLEFVCLFVCLLPF